MTISEQTAAEADEEYAKDVRAAGREDDGGPSLRERRREAGRGYNPAVYILWFLLTDFLAMAVLEMSVSPDNPWHRLSAFLQLCVTQHRFVWALNMIILGLIYAVFLFLFNRFWVASPVFLSLATVIAVVEEMKVSMRNEPILPSDLLLAGGGSAGSLTDFIPDNAFVIIISALGFILVTIFLNVILARFDGRKGAIFTSRSFEKWVHGLREKHGDGTATASRRAIRVIAQILLIALPAGLVGGYAANLSLSDTFAARFSAFMGDIPHLWDAVLDAEGNGTIVGFMRLTHITVMNEPSGYSEKTMKAIAARYSAQAKEINASRPGRLTDNTVITILSESYSDPTRVPGVSLNTDPMPEIRQIKKDTTSGLMLSSGYGGGTANLEYMATTGLSMANFAPSMTAPYTQLVPTEKWPFAFSQMWNQAGQQSLGFHPYNANLYFRAGNYKRFGFHRFYAQTGTPYVFRPQKKIDRNPYVDDASSYQAILDSLRSDEKAGYYQLETMQNHMNYNNWYDNNEFEVSGKLGTAERMHIRTYAKGVQYTSQATKDFLDGLDQLSRPVTVIWYGDHLPGIYDTASRSTKNSVALHETDYFIWSNKATKHVTKLPASAADYSSPNFFMAQAAWQTGSKVSPYLAFLTRLHEQVPAMEPPVVNTLQTWDRIPSGEQLNLMADGKTVATKNLPKKAAALLRDYRLIQYDMTCGKGYLRHLGFVDLPRE